MITDLFTRRGVSRSLTHPGTGRRSARQQHLACERRLATRNGQCVVCAERDAAVARWRTSVTAAPDRSDAQCCSRHHLSVLTTSDAVTSARWLAATLENRAAELTDPSRGRPRSRPAANLCPGCRCEQRTVARVTRTTAHAAVDHRSAGALEVDPALCAEHVIGVVRAVLDHGHQIDRLPTARYLLRRFRTRMRRIAEHNTRHPELIATRGQTVAVGGDISNATPGESWLLEAHCWICRWDNDTAEHVIDTMRNPRRPADHSVWTGLCGFHLTVSGAMQETGQWTVSSLAAAAQRRADALVAQFDRVRSLRDARRLIDAACWPGCAVCEAVVTVADLVATPSSYRVGAAAETCAAHAVLRDTDAPLDCDTAHILRAAHTQLQEAMRRGTGPTSDLLVWAAGMVDGRLPAAVVAARRTGADAARSRRADRC